MAFKRVGLSKEPIAANLREQLATMATYEPEDSMSSKRFLGSFLSLMFGITAIYASIFYVPAFYDFKKALGFSTDQVKLPEISMDDRHVLSAYTDRFKLRRGYLRQGQALEVKYALSPGTKMTLTIQRCSAPVFVEVVYCMNTEGQEVVIRNEMRGTRALIMRHPGFYYFDETVTNLDGSPTTKPFTVVWTRKI